jgi:beta-glucosidase
VKQSGLPTVVVLISGRPMILEPILGSADAIVAAWLPGTEGDGVADVLFGKYNPTGKLGHTWPASMAQIPINVGPKGEKPNATPLFPYGFGLSYPTR